MQLNEAIRLLTEFFERKEIDSAKLTAELLVAHVLKCKRIDVFLNYDKILTEQQISELRKLSNRRAMREPLQYIIGEVDFCGNKLITCKDVLIPRPETEELVYKVFDKVQKNSKILDLGTGTGAIAISLAKLLPDANIIAIDKNPKAISVATKNAEINNVKNVTFLYSNWFSEIHEQFDCIVSNPPYLSENEWLTAAPEVKNFEPKDALTATNEGINDLEAILSESVKYIAINGFVALETGINHHPKLTKIAQNIGYVHTESHRDMAHYNRFFFATKDCVNVSETVFEKTVPSYVLRPTQN